METLEEEFAEAGAAWERQEAQTVQLLQAICACLQDSGAPAPLSRVPELAGLGEAWKGVHAQLSKYSKALERRVRGDFVDLVRDADAESAQTAARHDEAVHQALLQHFYREGSFEAGDALAADMQSMADAQLKEPFERMHALVRALAARDIAPAVRWAQQHERALGAAGHRLQFQLHALAFIGLLRADQHAALRYAQRAFPPFAAAFAPDVQTLMGALAFGHCLAASPYRAILYDDMWGEAEDVLVAAYCALLGLPKESALRLCLNIGSAAWPKISRVLALMKDRPGVEWNPHDELPVEVDAAHDVRFHSVFVCPVLRQQSTPANPPMMIPCGHVISQEALLRLSKGNPNYRIKCPYCPAESTAAMAQKIVF